MKDNQEKRLKLVKNQYVFEDDEEMVSIGKYLAYVMIIALLLFIPIAVFLPNFIDKFTSYALGILGIVTAGVVVYIVVNLERKKR